MQHYCTGLAAHKFTHFCNFRKQFMEFREFTETITLLTNRQHALCLLSELTHMKPFLFSFIARIQELVRQDRRRTIHNIAEEVEIGYGTCQWVLMEELGMHRVTAKFVPRILTDDQKQQRINVCTELRQLTSDVETFLSRVITSDKSWVYGYDSETKQQSSQ